MSLSILIGASGIGLLGSLVRKYLFFCLKEVKKDLA